MKRKQGNSKKWGAAMVVALVAIGAGLGIPAKNGCGGSAGDEENTGTTLQGLQGENLSVVSTSIAPRVKPGGSLAVTVTLKNTGSTTWQPASMKLSFDGNGTANGAWANGDLSLARTTKPNQTGIFSGTLTASTQIGRYALSWRATNGGTAFGAPITGTTEITCSDGVFCNGDERWSNGKCVAGPPPCDDKENCTTDTCDEANGRCAHSLGNNCNACMAKNCNPSCHGKLCGDDGCGGSCGTCDPSKSCVNGACAVVTVPGSCANPLPLLNAGAALLGEHTRTGDTSTGVNEVYPTCNSTSTARELIYGFTVTAADGSVGIDARSSGFDTVLHIRKASCTDPNATVGCADDSAPPGNYGSRVAALLGPGTYFLIVDGFDGSSVGPFTLTARFAANCVPACDGRFCGNNDGCGGTCGVCAAGQECNTAGRCIKAPCTPDCNGRKCGDDGCGGTCGDCTKGQLCITETGACKSFAVCDHDRPVCKTACSSTQYCGTDCLCHRNIDPRPDLVVDKARLANEILFETRQFNAASCAVAEQCVGGTGARKLLRFSVEAVNQGQATATVPPPADRPDLFNFSTCHGHYHFNGFANYALLDLQGKVIKTGQKQAYCMEDTVQFDKGPGVACEKKYDCSVQGIQKGWSDLYGNALDCQWLDVTGIPPGNYQLSVTVNPGRAFEEGSFDNNTTTVPVTVP